MVVPEEIVYRVHTDQIPADRFTMWETVRNVERICPDMVLRDTKAVVTQKQVHIPTMSLDVEKAQILLWDIGLPVD